MYSQFLNQMPPVLRCVSSTVRALMEKWSVEQLTALVSGFTSHYSFKCTFTCVPPCFLLSMSLSFCPQWFPILSLSFSVFNPVCVSQWTVAGAAGPSGVLAVERVMLVWEGGIVREPILLQLLGVVHAKETELGSIPAALSPALVRKVLGCKFYYKQFWNESDESNCLFIPVRIQRNE